MGSGFPDFVEDELDVSLESGMLAHRCRHRRCADDNHKERVALTDDYRSSCTPHRDVIA
jgi:hypothetical protein